MGNSAASTWTQLRGATPPGGSGEGFPAKALLGAGRAEGLEGLPGEKTRHLQGVEEAWGGLAGASGRKTDVAGASYGASEGRGLLTGLGFVF